jgi:hypothetical protein
MSISSDNFRLRPALVTILLAVVPATAIFIWHASRYGSWLIDDAGISFAYARNLAEGFGLTAQPGQVPVEGFSNPLWTLALALLNWLKIFALPLTPKLLCCLLVLGSFLVFAVAVLQLSEQTDAAIVASFTLAMTAANPGFVIWCVSGLENPLLVLLSAVLLLICIRTVQRRPGKSESIYAGLTVAGLALTRPDGIIYALVFPIACSLRARPYGVRSWVRGLLTYAVCIALPFGSYLVFRRVYFGDWLPNTYYAKPGVSLQGLIDLLYMWGLGGHQFSELARAIFPLLPLLFLLLVFATVFNLLRSQGVLAAREDLIICIMVLLSFAGFLILPNDWMGEFRFATVAFPFTYLLCFRMARQAIATLPQIRSKRAFLIFLGSGLLIGSVPFFAERSLAYADHPAASLDTVARKARRFNELADVLSVKNASLLAPDLGGELLWSKLRLIDVAGLCDRTLGRMYRDNASPAQFAEYILRQARPDFVNIHDYWAYRSGLLTDREFASAYLDLGAGEYVRRAALPVDISDERVRSIVASLPSDPPK